MLFAFCHAYYENVKVIMIQNGQNDVMLKIIHFLFIQICRLSNI